MQNTLGRSLHLQLGYRERTATTLQTELLRKSIHFLIALVPSLALINREATALILVCGICVYTLCEALRLEGFHIPFVSNITEKASRERDYGKFVLGPVTLGLGALLALVFYPAPAASVAIYTLAFGDGIASLVGRHLGRIRPRFLKGKSIEGSLACFTLVLAIVIFSGFPLPMAILVAFSATVIEALPLKDYDNLVLPVSIGFIVEIIRLIQTL